MFIIDLHLPNLVCFLRSQQRKTKPHIRTIFLWSVMRIESSEMDKTKQDRERNPSVNLEEERKSESSEMICV